MAYITIVINPDLDTINTLNGIVKPTKDRETVNSLVDYLTGLSAGVRPGAFYIVTTGTDPAVATDADPNSTKTTFNGLK